jgi:hypothetical protein
VRHVLRAVLVGAALAALWLLYVGEYTHVELAAAIVAAALVFAWSELVRRQGLARFRIEREWAVRAAKTPLKMIPDFVRVLATLPRVRQGSFRAVDFPAGGDDPTSAGRRAIATYFGSFTPTTVVVNIDVDHGEILLHDFPPSSSEKPPL